MTIAKDFASVQEALQFVAANPSMDELMSRVPEYPRKDLRFIIKFQHAQRWVWQHNADKREAKRNGEDEEG